MTPQRRAAAIPRRVTPLAALLLGGCAAFTSFGSLETASHAGQPFVAGSKFYDWKGVVHCHSLLSHDSEGTIDEISAACREAKLDFLVMTDHQTDESIRSGQRGMVGDTLFLVGAEVRSPQGTLLCFPLTKPLRHFQHPALLAKEAAEQGGLAFVCHGELWKCEWDAPGLHGAEIVNLHAGAMTVNKLGTLGTALALPMRSLCERICYRDPKVLREYDRQLNSRHPFAPIGGNDAHANISVFGPLGGTIGTYREIFLTLSTHVLATELSEAALLEAFRAGRTYVSFDIFGEGTGFDFRIEDASGNSHLGGATLHVDEAKSLKIRTPGLGQIRLLRDGVEIGRRLSSTFQMHDLSAGVYRVEVQTPNGEPWLFSSSIRIVDEKTTR
jgi:hypothetical protein